MTTRSRTYNFPRPTGGNAYRTISGSVVVNTTQTSGTILQSKCDDVSGNPKGENPLSIVSYDNSGILPLNGELDSGFGNVKRYSNFYPINTISPAIDLTVTLPTSASVALSTLAASNPSRPYVSVPNFVYELKDLPEMIRDIGRIKLYAKRYYYRKSPNGYRTVLTSKDIANHYLSGIMGWSPLFSDIRKMLNIQAQVDRKTYELDRLFNHHKGLHRTIRSNSWKFVLSSETTELIETSLGVNVSCKVFKTTTAEMWGSVRWFSTVILPRKHSSSELHKQAMNLVLGLNLNPKAVWDAFPWTWFVDWFLDVGTYLQAYTNVIDVIPSLPCVMTHIRTEAHYTRNDSLTWLRGGDGVRIHETKLRSIQSGTPSASMPFLTARQLSTLASLAVQRGRL